MPSDRILWVTEMQEAGVKFDPCGVLAFTTDTVADLVYHYWVREGKPKGATIVIVLDGKQSIKSIGIKEAK